MHVRVYVLKYFVYKTQCILWLNIPGMIALATAFELLLDNFCTYSHNSWPALAQTYQRAAVDDGSAIHQKYLNYDPETLSES
jgi:hypothetical protein